MPSKATLLRKQQLNLEPQMPISAEATPPKWHRLQSPPTLESRRDPAQSMAMHTSLTPLLRGIGTTVILAAMVIAFCIAGRDDPTHPMSLQSSLAPSTVGQSHGSASRANPQQPAQAQATDSDDLIEELFDNDWLQWMSFAGTAIIAASFFTEAFRRRATAASATTT